MDILTFFKHQENKCLLDLPLSYVCVCFTKGFLFIVASGFLKSRKKVSTRAFLKSDYIYFYLYKKGVKIENSLSVLLCLVQMPTIVIYVPSL